MIKQKIMDMQAFLLALLFAVFIFFFEESAFQNPQGYQLLLRYQQGGIGFITTLLTTLASFFLLVFFAWFALSIPRRWRWLPGLIFAAAALTEFNYWQLFHRELSPTDISAALSAPLRMWNASAQIYFNWLALLPAVVFGILLFLRGQPSSSRARGLAASMAACMAVIMLSSALHYPTNWGSSLPRFYRTVVQWSFSGIRAVDRLEVSPPPALSPPTNNIVLIIDESIRSDHLSLNGYSRPTTPYLDELQASTDLIHNWGTAVAGATCSTPSNDLLITGVVLTPQNASTWRESVKRNPTLFHYAKAMGYRTAYLDAQTNYLWNGLTPADLEYVDQWLTLDDLGGGQAIDQAAADWVFNQISQSTGNFIIVNKQGSHYLYEDSYPASEQLWGPIPTDYHTQPELVNNAYDNSIHYTVDLFFRHLLVDEEAALKDTIYLYTSDHAQTLFENGATWLHCNYTALEASVPLLMIGKLPTEVDLTYPARHSNIFPTLLDLMQVPDGLRVLQYDQSLLEAGTHTPPHRFFVSGDGSLIPFD